MIKYAVFDFDGTLVDSNNIKLNAFFQVTNNLPNSKAIIEEILLRDVGDRNTIFEFFSHAMYSEHGISVNINDLISNYTLLCEDEVSQAISTKDSDESLEKLLSMGIKIFISSATPEQTLNIIVNKRGNSHLFNGIYGSPNSKEMHIHNIRRLFQCHSSEIIYVGDSEVDRVAALRTNCHFFGIGHDFSRFSIKPQVLRETLHDLPKWVSTFT